MSQIASEFGRLGGLLKGISKGAALREELKLFKAGKLVGPVRSEKEAFGNIPLLSMHRLGTSVGMHPVASTIGAATTLPWVAEMGSGLFKDLGQDLNVGGVADDRLDRSIRAQREADALGRLIQRRREDHERIVEQNLALMAERAPHLFNTLSAGRRLPKGARVFGGTPRTDLLTEVASRMADGHYTPPPSNPLMDGEPNALPL